MEKKARDGGGGELVERLPQAVLVEVLEKLDLDSLCSADGVCRAFRLAVSQALSCISTLDLSGFSPTVEILNRVLSGNSTLLSLTLDCSLLDDSSIAIFAKKHLHRLSLLKCSSFSSYIFVAIGEKCPNLSLFAVELAHSIDNGTPIVCNQAITQMFKGCLFLESLTIKFHLQHPVSFYSELFPFVLPQKIKVLLLQPISNWQARLLFGSNVSVTPWANALNSLSLVLDLITDDLLSSISNNLTHLTELCLEDNPFEGTLLNQDLTNNGLQSLGFCKSLIRLQISRNKQHSGAIFKRVNDVGMFLLAEGCKRLESVRLGGFSRVTDAGYASILHSCKNLKKFEIINASFLSDLAFLDLAGAVNSLVEVRLVSCNLLTGETPESLSYCRNLEVLDLSGCRSISDYGLSSISRLCKLTTLDLGGADITDAGLSALSCGTSSISSLCLRGCKRVTDKGLALLLHENSIIGESLLTLDLGYMPRISDRAVTVIVEVCRKLTSLCLRNCFLITSAAVAILGSLDQRTGGPSIRMLDLCHCSGISADSLELLAYPFRGLRWLGVGGTRFLANGKSKVMETLGRRQGLKICVAGCEMGCKRGWQHH